MELGNNEMTYFLPLNIRCLRRKLGMSQEELAQEVGLNRGNIASYENGTAEPKICNLLKIAARFGVSILDLTQRDLSENEAQQAASDAYRNLSQREGEALEQYQQKALEVENFLEGIHKCFEYHRSKLNGQAPREMHFAFHYFEQVHEAAQSLLHHHKSLLDFIHRKSG